MWSLILWFACGAGGGPDDGVEIGTGLESFQPLTDGGRLDLVRGSQGLQHLVVSLRAPIDVASMVVPRAQVALSLWEEDVAAAPTYRAGLALHGTGEVIGVLYVIEDPETVVDRVLRLEAELTPVGESSPRTGEVSVEVGWAP